ncbi:MAG: hypothetical protein JSU90_08135 [Nitrospiraceae bacterium]|nr:MAG: hypothetical protein JSU90_08135 [Nitrospiraceae bacterium]
MENVFIDPFKRFIEKIAGFLPNLLTGAILIVVGFISAWIVRTIVTKTVQFLKIDRLSDRVGLGQILLRGGIRDPFSRLIGKAAYWIILISFIIMGLDALQIPAVEKLLSEFWLYLPNVIVATVIIMAGYLLGNFLGRAALIASVNAGVAIAGLLGKFVKFTVFIMAATMALELLGIGEETVLIAFAIVFGGVVLAISIAFGFGARDIARDYLDKMLREKKDEDDISHI